VNRHDLRLRPAAIDDAGTIHRLEADAFGPDAWGLSAVAAELQTQNRRIALAQADERVIGWVAVSVVADVADLTRIAVVSDARRKGTGAALLGWALHQARIAGAERMILEVAETNAAAIGLYGSEGFAEIARRAGYYGGTLDALVLQRPVRLGE
jgi:ribosomal-protein-alanine acetyltransferase